MSDRDADHMLSELQEARAEVDRLRSDLAGLRLLVLQQTSVTSRGERYWPEWVNKYFDSIGSAKEVSMSEDAPAFYWEMMFKNLTRENSRLLDQLCEADEKIAELESENAKMRDLLRWRDAYGEPPTEEGIYLVINNDFDGGTSIHATYWKGKWPIGFTVPYWRPIGPLPGGEP